MFVKRLMDIALSMVLLLLLIPLFAVVAILIKLDDPGRVFFRQERVGKDGKRFRLLKFRSMVENAEKKGLKYEVSQNDNRITSVGKFLREWGIDELPQLVNVLKGEMSLVGPRGARPDQVEKFTDNEKNRTRMKPGITGWALVNGRNSIDWRRRIELDNWYIENYSLLLDIKILFKTIRVVLVSREGVYGPEGVTRDYRAQI